MSRRTEIIQHEYHTGLPRLDIDQRVDLVFADPPYNIGVKYADDLCGDKLSDFAYWNTMTETMVQLRHASRDAATLWWVCPEAHGDKVGQLLTENFGPRLYRIVWHETFSQYNRFDLTQDYRFIFCHTKDEFCRSDQKRKRRNITKNLDAVRIPSARMLCNDRRQSGPKIPGRVWETQTELSDELTDQIELLIRGEVGPEVPGEVWKLRRLQGTATARVKWHPAQMPPEVLERIVKGWSNKDDVILDAFAGSASMGIVCQALDRRFIGVDKSRTYCQNMRKRLGIERKTGFVE